MRIHHIAFVLGTSVIALRCNRSTPDEDRVRRIEQRADAFAADADDAHRRARELSKDWEDLRERHSEVLTRMRETETALENARSNYNKASSEYQQADATAGEARRRWELFRELVQVAASIDARNLDASRGGARVGSDLNCDDGRSTSAYRAMLIAQGKVLTGKDIDHIVPRSLGGADHPSNYQVLDSSVNRSLGNAWNEAKCAAVGAERCAKAVHISRRCGSFDGPAF